MYSHGATCFADRPCQRERRSFGSGPGGSQALRCDQTCNISMYLLDVMNMTSGLLMMIMMMMMMSKFHCACRSLC